MSNTYTKESQDIYFLNDKNILSSFGMDGQRNPIPSYDLVQGIENRLNWSIFFRGEIEVNRTKSLTISQLISNHECLAGNNTIRCGYAYKINVPEKANGDGSKNDFIYQTSDATPVNLVDGTLLIVHSCSKINDEDGINPQDITSNDVVIIDPLNGNVVYKGELNETASNLNGLIDRKIYLDGISAETLSVEHIDWNDYTEKVKNGTAFSNCLYVVSSDVTHSYNKRIVDLGEPVLSGDATTKNYVDVHDISLSNELTSLMDSLSSENGETISETSVILTNLIGSTSADLTGLMKGISSDLTGIIDSTSVDLTGIIGSTSVILDAEIKDLSGDVSNISSNLSSKIDSKIYIDNLSVENLRLEHISWDSYKQKLSDDQILSNCLYVVSSDVMHSYNERIVDLGEPLLSGDATTKNYVDSHDTSLSNKLTALMGSLSSTNKQTIATISGVLSNRIEDLSGDVGQISSQLINRMDSKIYIDDVSSSTLKIIHTDTRDAHYWTSKDPSQISDMLFIVSSENHDVMGERIVHLADPVDLSDGVNLKTMRDSETSLSNNLTSYVQTSWSSQSAILTDIIEQSSNALALSVRDAKSEQYQFASTFATSAYNLSIGIHTVEDNLKETSSYLNTKINNKIIGKNGNLIDSLSVVEIDTEDYYQKCKDRTLNENVLYLLTGDYINAYDKQIKNLSEPTLSTDAATKYYVDSQISALDGGTLNRLRGIGEDFYDEISSDPYLSNGISETDQISTIIKATVKMFNTLSALKVL